MNTKLKSIFLYNIIFFSFVGFYVSLILFIQLGIESRMSSIPIKLIVISSYILLLLLNIRKLKSSKYLKFFIIFALLLLSRIIVDNINNQPYYLSTSETILYFFSSAIIPFLVMNLIMFEERYVKIIWRAIITSGVLFGVLSVLFYSKYIGIVVRLNSSTAQEEVLSPLSLSYCSCLVIVIIITYLMFNKVNLKAYIIYFCIISLLVVPFFLGASRGAIISLFTPFLFILVLRKNLKNKFLSVIVLIISLLIFLYLNDKLNSSAVYRLINLQNDISEGSSSAIRLTKWESVFNQFLNNPIIGGRLKGENLDTHPHNIILEILQSTGIFGFVFFCILLYHSFKACFIIIKIFSKYSWVTTIFIVSFIQNMVSGSIFTATWFWTSMSIILSLYFFLNKTYKSSKQVRLM